MAMKRRWNEMELSERLGYLWLASFVALVLATAATIVGPPVLRWWNEPPAEEAAVQEGQPATEGAPAAEAAAPAEGQAPKEAEPPKEVPPQEELKTPQEEPKKEGRLSRPLQGDRLAALSEDALYVVVRADRFSFVTRSLPDAARRG
jgi:hypothetical protein